MDEAGRFVRVLPHSVIFWFTPQLVIELFVFFNFLVLAFDIYLAHSENEFYWRAEYFPVYFAAAGSVILFVGLMARQRWRRLDAWRDLGYLVGWASVATGLAGVIYHLDRQFF